ncbi:MAG: efflux RND transporter periplasmic adaptor subunit [Clostridia bacterium]|nr:efflux RND transporter periplasmic adaptor subunit [Clostridia bacterium]
MKKFLKSGWFKFIILILVIIAISTAFYFKEDVPQTYRTASVTRGNIESSVEGSGAISSSESRKVYSKVSSEVLSVLHKEGDFVKEGEALVTLDSSTLDSSIDSQKIAIEQANLSIQNINKQIADLTIVANSAGYVSNLTIGEGSYITTSMQVCDIVEEGQYEIVLPFGYSEVNKIQIGNSAKIQLIENFATLDGVVTKVSEMRKLATGSSQVVDVTIKVSTSGYSLAGAQGKGEIIVNGTRQGSTSSGTFKMVSSNVVRAKSTGTVEKLNVYEGKYVNVGDVVAVLSNEDLNSSLKNARLTLQNLNTQYASIKDQLDNYTIKAPLSGTITAQSITNGDMIAAGTPILTISNKDLLEFKIPVDELDIAKLNYDEEVRVTIDALEETQDAPIQGKITKLPLEGTSTAGVTEYFVTVQIPGDENIRISMNANAKIITHSQKDVLMVPVDSVTKENGDSYVTVVLEDGTTERKLVELGERNVSYVEIKSGLSEGEKVVIPQISDSYSWF